MVQIKRLSDAFILTSITEETAIRYSEKRKNYLKCEGIMYELVGLSNTKFVEMTVAQLATVLRTKQTKYGNMVYNYEGEHYVRMGSQEVVYLKKRPKDQSYYWISGERITLVWSLQTALSDMSTKYLALWKSVS